MTDVDAGGPAERAGIRVGDRVEGQTSLADRLYLQGLRLAAPGQSFAFLIRGKNGSHLVHFRVGAMGEPNAAFSVYYFAGVLIDLIFIVVGSILVLSRPSRMTWAFFLYCIAMAPGLISFPIIGFPHGQTTARGSSPTSYGRSVAALF